MKVIDSNEIPQSFQIVDEVNSDRKRELAEGKHQEDTLDVGPERFIFVVPLSIFLPISFLLFTQHSGAVEKLTITTFFLIILAILWTMVKQSRGDEGNKGD